MRGTESIALATGNLTAGNKTASVITGGVYALTVQATGIDGNNTVTVQVEDPSSNWVNAAAATTANGMSVLQLPAGQVRVAIAGNLTNAAIYASRVPYE